MNPEKTKEEVRQAVISVKVKKLKKQKETLKKSLGELENYNIIINHMLSNKENLIPGKESTEGLEELRGLNETAIELNRKEIKRIEKKLKNI